MKSHQATLSVEIEAMASLASSVSRPNPSMPSVNHRLPSEIISRGNLAEARRVGYSGSAEMGDFSGTDNLAEAVVFFSQVRHPTSPQEGVSASYLMIETPEQAYQAIEQMGRMQRILESYQNEILGRNPRNFAVLAEGPL